MDFDGDGRHDVLTGSWPGELYLFRRGEDGKYGAAEQLKDADGNPIKPGSASTVFAADWDADGDLDLVMGNIKGEVKLALNEGSRTEPRFGERKRLATSDQLANRSGDSGPIVADWDCDGLADLLVGMGNGSVVWFRNGGTAEEPQLESAQQLVGPSPCGWNWAERKPGQWGVRVKICVTDYNGDGRPDLLLGDRSGSVKQNAPLTAEQQARVDEAKTKLAEVRKERIRLLGEIRTLTARIEAADEPAPQDAEQLQKLQDALKQATDDYAALSAVVRSASPTQQVRQGFVWLFLRKPAEE